MGAPLSDVSYDLRLSRRLAAEALRRATQARDARAIAVATRKLQILSDALLWASWGDDENT